MKKSYNEKNRRREELIMGQYVQAGICNKVIIYKDELEGKVTYEELIEGMNKELNLELYNISDEENTYVFSLKSELLDKDKLIEFLKEQYDLCDLDTASTQEVIDKLKKVNNSDEIINLAKEKKYQNFCYNSYIYGNIYCTKWQYRVMVQYELVLYLIEGKIMMECYYDFLKYIENLIRKNSKNELNSAVKVVIS